MKKYVTTFTITVAILSFGFAATADVSPLHGLTEVRHHNVNITGGFWQARLKTHHETTIPHALDCLERNGHVTNFDKAAGTFDGPLRGHHAFDSDIHKAMEGAMYSLAHHHDNDHALSERVDSILDRILAAQQTDGYLISYFIVKDLRIKWDDVRLQHQMYNAGHFFEMAVEHHRLTDDPKALNAAKKFADHIDRTFGEGKRYDVGGHEEIELALIKLYRATNEPRYLKLCRFLLDERGHLHGTQRKPFTPGPLPVPERLKGQTNAEYNRAKRLARLRWRNGRMQDHKPLTDQHEATGHAVRAGYIYSAMTDIARFSHAPEYENAVDHLWQNIVSQKMYVNGAVGTAQYGDEGFGDPYLLPNRTYCESCASIAHVFFQHRMNLLKADAKYADVMELALYNAVLAGISIKGDAFFYQNPLQSKGATRSSWIGLACCPTNLTRIIPQIGNFIYAQSKDRLYVNLYAESSTRINLHNRTRMRITQQTNYPWDGSIKLTLDPHRPTDIELCLRIPGWAQGRPVPSDLYRFANSNTPPVTIKVNGKATNQTPAKDGYVHLKRNWKPGDTVQLNLPMPIRRIGAHENIEADRNKVALMRGPITYCLEAIDNPETNVLEATLPPGTQLKATHQKNLLGGVTILKSKTLTAMPYYAWTNRKKGPMAIWINETPAPK